MRSESQALVPGTNRTIVGNDPAFAPHFLWKGGLTLRRDKCMDVSLTAMYVSDEFGADSNIGTATIPAKIPSYRVLNLDGNFYITDRFRLTGISNLADEKYYSQVFFNGTIEPAPPALWLCGCVR